MGFVAMMTEHDKIHMSHSKRVNHALERFEQRHNRKLLFEEYWQMVLALRAGRGEIVRPTYGTKGSIYQLEWRGEILYPTFTARETRGNIITTFLTPHMVLHKLCFPYFGVGRDRSKLEAKIARKKALRKELTDLTENAIVSSTHRGENGKRSHSQVLSSLQT